MSPDLEAIFSAFSQGQQAYATLGILGALSVGTYLLIRLYRLALVQSLVVKLSPKLAWDAWPRWAKLLTVFGLSLVTTITGALANGIGWGPALVAGIGTGIGALGSDQVVSGVVKAGEKTNQPEVP